MSYGQEGIMGEGKASLKAFVADLIEILQKEGAKGLSGGSPAAHEILRTCFSEDEPFHVIEEMIRDKIIAVRPLKNGVSITLRQESTATATAAATLEKMGIGADQLGILSAEEFIIKAISKLRREGYKGIHSVFSGFNEAFMKYFSGQDPAEVTARLAKEGKIVLRPTKRGVMLYLPGDAPPAVTIEDTLKKMGLSGGEVEKLSHEEFVKKAIHSLRSGEYKGIHSVYSGFNDAFKKYFGTDPVVTTSKLANAKIISIRPVRGGVMMYFPEDAPSTTNVDEIFKKMNLSLDAHDRISPDEFVKKAIVNLRREGYKGIHSVYSGFNEAFKKYFGADPVEITMKLAKEDKIAVIRRRGGAMLYLPEEAPKGSKK